MHYLGLSCFLYDKNYQSNYFINTQQMGSYNKNVRTFLLFVFKYFLFSAHIVPTIH